MKICYKLMYIMAIVSMLGIPACAYDKGGYDIQIYKDMHSLSKLKGDVNGDGTITVADSLLYLRYSTGQDVSPYIIDTSDDVTCDGTITVADALLVLRKSVGQDVNLNCGPVSIQTITNLHNVSYAQDYINWTWISPEDPDFSKINIYIDGLFIRNMDVGIGYYNATNFMPDTIHGISTQTVDIYGNINQTWKNDTERTASQGTSAFKFVAWGDTKGGVNILEGESNSMVNKNPSFTLYVGDLCSSGPDSACFHARKDAFNGDSSGATSNGLFDKTFAIRGNHDSSGGSVWQSGFNFKSVASSIGATNYVEQTLDMTYSFDYGNSHFVGLDNPCSSLSNCAGDITSSQITWLDNDLKNAENRGLKHAFLFWHGPAYPVDGHCCGGISSAMITVLNKHPIISAGFFGHEHVIEYTHLDSSIIPSLKCSFEQVISGGAGAGLYSLTGGRRVDYYLGQIDGYTMVDVSGNDFTISFYKADGTLMKTLSFTETGTCQ